MCLSTGTTKSHREESIEERQNLHKPATIPISGFFVFGCFVPTLRLCSLRLSDIHSLHYSHLSSNQLKRNMAGESSHASGSYPHRRNEEDRPSYLHRHRHRHRDSSRRHRGDSDDETGRHSSLSSHSDRKGDSKDRNSSRHGHRDDHHRSSHHHSSRDLTRERDDEDHSDRKRRHREEDVDERKRRHDGRRSEHRRHRRDEDEPRYRSRSDKDQRTSKDDSEKQPATDFIPTSDSLQLISHATSEDQPSNTTVAANTTSEPASTLKRDDWMTGGGSDSQPDEAAYFSSFGKERVKAPRPEKLDPEKLKISSRELNTQLVEGKTVDEYETPLRRQRCTFVWSSRLPVADDEAQADARGGGARGKKA